MLTAVQVKGMSSQAYRLCRRAGNYPNTSSCSTHQIGDLPCRMQLAHTVYPPLFPLPQAFLQTIRAIPPLPAVSRSRCRFFRAPAVYKPFSSLPDSVGAAHQKRNTGIDFGSAGVPKSTPANPSAQIHADGQRKYPVQKRLPGPTDRQSFSFPSTQENPNAKPVIGSTRALSSRLARTLYRGTPVLPPTVSIQALAVWVMHFKCQSPIPWGTIAGSPSSTSQVQYAVVQYFQLSASLPALQRTHSVK